MKHLYKNWLVKLTLGFAALTSLRLVSTLLHMTTLEKIYKPRDFRRTSHLEIDDHIISQLPKNCTNLLGQVMDPINLVFVGTEAGIFRAFEKAGWGGAHPSTPIHLAMGFLSGVLRRSYSKGPFMPLFTGIGLQDMSFQKVTEKNKFAERHHIRIWRTRFELPGGNRIWVGAATHEVGMRLTIMPPFIVHRMDPDIDYERDLIAAELVQQGNLLADDIRLNPKISAKKPRRNPHGDKYFADGKAKVIEIV